MKPSKYFYKEFVITCVNEQNPTENYFIRHSEDAVKYIYNIFENIDVYESFYAIFLNRAHKVIGHAKISQGGISGTVTDIRIIAKYAIDCLASSIIVAHSHPSGNEKPSQSDIDFTNTLKNGLSILEIHLLDSLILTPDPDIYFSFSDNNICFEENKKKN